MTPCNWYSVRGNVAKAPFPAIVKAYAMYYEALENAGQKPEPLPWFARELFPKVAAQVFRDEGRPQ